MPSHPLRSPALPRALTLAAALAVACSATLPLRAARPNAPATPAATAAVTLPSGVRQLIRDLKSITSGSAVTDEQKQALADDLAALADGLVRPSSSSLEQLADDLAAAAASGRLTPKVERILARDLASLLTHADLDPAALRALLAEVRTILAAYNIDAADLQQLAADLEAIIDDFQTDSSTTHQAVTLQAEGIPSLLLMNYGGRARLVTVHTEGRPVQTVLSITTSGLPPANPFTVAITRRSDGAQIVLGKLKVRSGGREIIHPHTASSPNPARPLPQAELDTHGETVFGGPTGKPLPDGFDPSDLDTLTITDSNNTERLTGSFLDPMDLQVRTRLVNWRVDAGVADPNASGAVSFRAKTTGTKTRDAFLLYVGGLPASASVTLLADGVDVGTFTTTTGGQLILLEGSVPVPTSLLGRMLPVNALPAAVDLNTLSSLTLTDATGNVLATAGM